MKDINVPFDFDIPEEKRLEVIDEAGNTQVFEIVLTFHSDELGKSYVVYKEPGDSDEVFAASFNEEEKEGGKLSAIDTDEEFDMIEEVLNTFLDDDGHSHD